MKNPAWSSPQQLRNGGQSGLRYALIVWKKMLHTPDNNMIYKYDTSYHRYAKNTQYVLIYIREGGMPKSSKPAEDFHAPATIVLS